MARVWAKALMPTLPKRALSSPLLQQHAPAHTEQPFGLFAQQADPVPQTPNCVISGSTAVVLDTEDTAVGQNENGGRNSEHDTMHASTKSRLGGGTDDTAPTSVCTHTVTVNASSGGTKSTHARARAACDVSYCTIRCVDEI
jgi:hypothetical protein